MITIAKLASGSYRASLDENRWESGRTEDIAIAKLVVNRGRELGIRVTFTRGQAS